MIFMNSYYIHIRNHIAHIMITRELTPLELLMGHHWLTWCAEESGNFLT